MADLLRRRSFVGRGVELARLRATLDDVVATGTGRTVILGGEAGIGKSRLIAQFASGLGASARVLEGATLEVTQGALPYAPFVEILRALVRDTPEAQRPALLGPGRGELTRLLPELATRSADVEPAIELDQVAKARLFELFLGVFERLAAAEPLVLVIEDLQWADQSSRDLIAFLSRAMRDDRALMVLSTRTDEAGAALGSVGFLAELEREDHVERIDLRPFDRDEIAEQAASLLEEPPPAGVIERLVARCDGNPFYVEELLLAGASEGARLPPVLRDVIAARVAGLSSSARDILRAAALAGRRIDDELLAVATGLSARELGAGLREALDSGVLVREEGLDGPVLSFRHGLLQDAINDELIAGERAALHFAFAEALEWRLGSGDRGVSPVELARHWDGARQGGRALPYMIQAAVAAEGVYAFPEALRQWERAAAVMADLPSGTEVEGRTHVEVLSRAGDCAALIGESRRAADLVQRALLQLYPEGDAERILELENRYRWHLWWAGERAAAIGAVERALEALPGEPATVARARVLAQLAGVRLLSGDVEGSAVAAREAIAIGERSGAVVEIALAYGVLGWDVAMLGDIDGGIAEYRIGQGIAEAGGSVEGIALAATNFVALLDRVGRSEEALEAARAGYALTERFGVGRTFGATLLGHAAKAELALGRWDEAEQSTAMGLRRGAVDAGAVWLEINRARLLTGRGRFEEAGTLLRRARATDDRLGGTEHRTALIAAEAERGAWMGDLPAVLRNADEGLAVLSTAGAPDPSLAWLAALVLRAIADAGQASAGRRSTPEAEELAAHAREITARIEAALALVGRRPGFSAGDRAQVLLAQLRAESDRVAGRMDPARWAEVARLWAALHRPFPRGYALLREAQAIVAARGDRARAAEALGEAAGIAARLGAEPLAALIATFARQARISLPSPETATASTAPASPAPADLYDLTAREAEVLRLVAAGWTNQQIADALFITRKTASVHVSNVMGKLGASNRGEAAALAHRLGMAADPAIP